jgi:putative transposase
MIDGNHALPIKRQAQLLGMSRGSVYYLPRPISAGELDLMRRIDELHLDFPFRSVRMLRRQLHRQRIDVGRRHIATLMQRMGIEALAPQPGTSKRAPGQKVYPYLLRKLAVERSNQVWALGTTYISMVRGFVYLTAVADVASRRVLAHKVAITLEAYHAGTVFELAFARWGTPEIINTDQGSRFTATEFADAMLVRGCNLNMVWRHNVFIERLCRSVKYERVYLRGYNGGSEARADMAEYVAWYKSSRTHSSLDEATPNEHYFSILLTLAMAAQEEGPVTP